MLIFIDLFFFVCRSNNIDEFFECFSEFSLVISVFIGEFFYLLEKTFIWCSRERPEETTKPPRFFAMRCAYAPVFSRILLQASLDEG